MRKALIRLASVLTGLILVVAALVVLERVLPAQGVVGEGKNYGYIYSGAKSASVDFNVAGSPDNSVLLFGSSELSTPASVVAEVPPVVFGTHDYGLDLTYVGEAYDQSLWQTIAAGAYAPQTSQKKVAIVVSPVWFTDGGLDNESFKLRFSYSLYRAFCSNPSISQKTKDYVAKRLAEQGIDQTTIDAGLRLNPVDALNDTALSLMDDLKLRSDLRSVRKLGLSDELKQNAPTSFDDLRAQALVDGAAASTSNSWGMDDAFYTSSIEGRKDKLRDSQTAETYKKTPEYEDFSFFLEVCKEVGFDPLVIISPLHGDFYDLIGVNAETRTYCYDRIKGICADYGVSVADFSNREYEKYFLHDIVHFGWTGWVDVEEAIYDFVND